MGEEPCLPCARVRLEQEWVATKPSNPALEPQASPGVSECERRKRVGLGDRWLASSQGFNSVHAEPTATESNEREKEWVVRNPNRSGWVRNAGCETLNPKRRGCARTTRNRVCAACAVSEPQRQSMSQAIIVSTSKLQPVGLVVSTSLMLSSAEPPDQKHRKLWVDMLQSPCSQMRDGLRAGTGSILQSLGGAPSTAGRAECMPQSRSGH